MTPTVPLIEIANDAHTPGIRSPHDKMHSGHPLYDPQVRPHCSVGLVKRAFGEQVEFEISKQWSKGIGVVLLFDLSPIICNTKAVGECIGDAWTDGFKKSRVVDAFHRDDRLCLGVEQNGHILGAREKAADSEAVGTRGRSRMGTEDRERIPMVTLDQLFSLFQ